MPKKTTEPENVFELDVTSPLEITDTNEIPVVSVDLDTSYEALLPDPVSASSHVALSGNYAQTFPARKYENLLPIVSTVVASVGVGATIFALGVVLGAGI